MGDDRFLVSLLISRFLTDFPFAPQGAEPPEPPSICWGARGLRPLHRIVYFTNYIYLTATLLEYIQREKCTTDKN